MTYIINPLTNQIVTNSVDTVKFVTGLDVSALKPGEEIDTSDGRYYVVAE